MNRRTLLLGSLSSLGSLGVGPVSLAEAGWLANREAGQDGAGPKRFALVLANQDYEKGPLENILADSKAMGSLLERLGFTVLTGTNQSRSGMLSLLREFRTRVESSPGCVALVYYSGHGASNGGENYLIPIQNASLSRAEDLPDECVPLGRVLEAMGRTENQLNLVILDACRDNPYPSSSKSQGSKGLTVVDRNTAGTLVAFAASPGQVASSNPEGANSLFTQELLKHLGRPGLRLEDVFLRTRAEVRRLSGGAQIPQEYGSLESVVYLAGGAAAGSEAVVDPAVSVAPTEVRLELVNVPKGAKVTVDDKPLDGNVFQAGISQATKE
ncbi:MAG: caspase family protein, partial [Armatimonadaceae bacterium]